MINISAPNAQEFAKIEKALKALPEEVTAQIETAQESLIGIDCTLKVAYGESNNITLPRPIDQLMTMKDEDHAVCGDFRFIIPKKGATKIHYAATPVTKR